MVRVEAISTAPLTIPPASGTRRTMCSALTSPARVASRARVFSATCCATAAVQRSMACKVRSCSSALAALPHKHSPARARMRSSDNRCCPRQASAATRRVCRNSTLVMFSGNVTGSATTPPMPDRKPLLPALILSQWIRLRAASATSPPASAR
ncbi:hypothetical protein D3C71_1033950 [compost metagenome]